MQVLLQSRLCLQALVIMLAYCLLRKSIRENVTIRFRGLRMRNVRAFVHTVIEVHSTDMCHVFPFHCIACGCPLKWKKLLKCSNAGGLESSE